MCIRDRPGTYNVKVMAKDSSGGWIGWSPSLEVTIASSCTLTWLTPYTSPSELAYLHDVIAEYQAQTGAKIQIESAPIYSPQYETSLHGVINAKHLSGSDPDMICMPAMWIPEFCDKYYPNNLLSEPPADVQADVRAKWTEASKNECEYIHTIWGYPSEFNSWGLVYNKKILEEVGATNSTVQDILDELDAGGTLTWGIPSIGTGELEVVAEACTDYDDGGVMNRSGWYPLYAGNPEAERYQFLSMLWSNGGEFIDFTVPKAVFNETEGVEVLQLYSWCNGKTFDGNSFPGDGIWWSSWAPPDYEIAMMLLPTWMGRYIRDAMGSEFNNNTLGIAPIPIGPSGTESVSVVDSWLNVITNASRSRKGIGETMYHDEAAWAFLKWLNTPMPNASGYGPTPDEHDVTRMGEFLISDMTMPSRISDQENFDILQTDFWLKGFMKIGEEYGRADTYFRTSEQVQHEVFEMIEHVATLGYDPEEMADFGAMMVNYYIPLRGDIYPDNKININDLVIVARAYSTKLGQPGWNPRADIIPDNKINIYDLVVIARNYGTKKPANPPGQWPCAFASSTASEGAATLEEFTALTEAATSVSVCPSQVSVGKYEGFSVNVTVTNATNLCGYDFKLYYDNAILNCANVTIPSDHFLKPLDPDSIYIVKQEYDNAYNSTHGCVWVAASLMAEELGKNGSGALATVTFQALASGTSALSLQEVELCDTEAESILAIAVDGSVTVYNKYYMRGDQHTVNGLTAYQLAANQSDIAKYTSNGAQGSRTVYWGTRVWVRHENGTEAEITAGTPVAIVSRGSSGQGIQFTTWSCPETNLTTTDAIIVRIYMKLGTDSWSQAATFITEQLNTTKLEQATWTVYYYTKRTYTPGYHSPGSTNGRFYWGTQTYNSHIENIEYT